MNSPERLPYVPSLEQQQLLAACQKVVQAGIWLLRNDYGRRGLLPYMAPSGCYWRIEFHHLGRPSQGFYRYSSGCNARYLQQHCGGTVRRDISPAGLAQAILASVPEEVQQRCKGPLSPATTVWLEELERVLAQGWLPSAFDEMSTSYARWDLTSPSASGLGRDMAPQPGYVPPGYESQVVPPTNGTRPISKSASTDAVQRRGTRLLAMVHELHKVGYQRLRICAGRSADSLTWRCHFLPAQDVLDDGWRPRTLQRSQHYTSVDGTAYFRWTDAASDDARTLAAKFLERFPDLAQASAGTDWAYAGWLTTVLGEAEQGRLPELYGGLDFELAHPVTPTPPAWVDPEGWRPSPEEIGTFIPHHALHAGMLPAPGACWDEIWPFCLTFDGYRDGLRSIDDCMHVFKSVFANGLHRASIDQLRTALFIEQRRLRNVEEMEPLDEGKYLPLLRELIEELHRRLTKKP